MLSILKTLGPCTLLKSKLSSFSHSKSDDRHLVNVFLLISLTADTLSVVAFAIPGIIAS